MRNYLAMGGGALRVAIAAGQLTLARQIALGAAFLALCGWKFTAGLSRVLDLDVSWHEARYLAWVTHHAVLPVPAEYSPLYVAFYRLEQLFAHDPVRLYYLNASVVAVLLPIAFFAYLMARNVPFVLALPCSAYLMISAADLPVGPKPVHFGLAIMFAALALFARLRDGMCRWTLILATAGCLSLARPEFLIALAALAVVVAARALGEPSARRIAWSIPLAAIAVAPVWWSFGLPLFNEKSMEAFARHFALNYISWQHLGEDPLTADYLGIFHSVFGRAQSIPAAFLANPAAFLHHLGLNLVKAPKVVSELFLAHYNILLPRFRVYNAIEAAALGIGVASLVVMGLRRRIASPPAAPNSSAGAIGRPARSSGLRHDFPDMVCLLCFLIPFPIMVTVLYPRLHYALAAGLIPIALALAAIGPRLHLPALRPAGRLLMLLLVFALIPSLGSAGASFTVTKAEVESRPNWNTVELLQQFHPTETINILEAAWLEPYLDPNFAGVSQEEKTGRFRQFLAARQIGVVIANDRLRNDRRFSLDPEWHEFAATPEKWGFKPLPVEESDIVIYLRSDLLGGSR